MSIKSKYIKRVCNGLLASNFMLTPRALASLISELYRNLN